MIGCGRMSLNDVVTSVTPVWSFRAGMAHGTASGFFYYYSGGLHLVTSRSIITGGADGDLPDSARLRLRTDPDDVTQSEEYVVALMDGDEALWSEHPTRADEVDIIAVPLDSDEIEARYVVRAFSILDQVPRDVELPLGEDVLVVAFPEGFYDDVHYLPIVRSAAIASVYPVPYQGRPFGLIDAHLPAQAAGAPVVTKGTPVVRRADGQSALVDQGENYLVGVYSAITPFRGHPESDAPIALSAVFYPWLVPEILSQQAQ